MDMHSGGGQKLEWSCIYIEAPEAEARVIFQNAFGRDPDNVTCNCCGQDYSVTESFSLAQATGFERNCRVLKTPRLPDGRYDNDNPVMRAHGYLEEGEAAPVGFEVHERRRFGAYVPLDVYVKRPDIKVIPAAEIRSEWRSS